MMEGVQPLDPDLCYAAASSRDARFDGRFIVAVRTTGIYCRPSCPAITPKRTNVEFHHTAASAQHSGFRACKRCHPDATPGSPDWNVRHDVVARAMRLIADGVVERDGVGGVASRLGYSERHLNRLVTDEVGAGPLAIARAQRAQTSRVLIETTDLPLTDVAFAAGFGSVRQFNDTIREVFDSTPSSLRRAAASRRDRRVDPGSAAATVSLRLPTRQPFAGSAVLDFLGRRAIPGVETFGVVDGVPTYRRTLTLPNGHGVVSLAVAPDADHVVALLRVDDWADLTTAVQRVRRMLDLDADPVAVDAHLGDDATLAPLVRAVPGRRSPGSVDPFETLVRAIIGQQISVAGARTVAAKLVDAAGVAVDPVLVEGWPELHRAFPAPEAIAAASDDALVDAHRPARHDPSCGRDGRRRSSRARRGRRPRRSSREDARAARYRSVDRRLRPHARPQPPRCPARHGPRGGACAPGHRRIARRRRMGAVALVCRAPPVGEPRPAGPARPPIGTVRSKGSVMSTRPSTEELARDTVDSPVGALTIVVSRRGLRAVLWPNDDAARVPAARPVEGERGVPVTMRAVIDDIARQLGEYFAGSRTEFDVALDPVGTAFQREAWQALCDIPFGETVSYGEQAARMGDRNKARAVGAANGRNPISIIVPCHRVVGRNGSLTGFAGGVATKRYLLDHERRVSGRSLL